MKVYLHSLKKIRVRKGRGIITATCSVPESFQTFADDIAKRKHIPKSRLKNVYFNVDELYGRASIVTLYWTTPVKYGGALVSGDTFVQHKRIPHPRKVLFTDPIVDHATYISWPQERSVKCWMRADNYVAWRSFGGTSHPTGFDLDALQRMTPTWRTLRDYLLMCDNTYRMPQTDIVCAIIKRIMYCRQAANDMTQPDPEAIYNAILQAERAQAEQLANADAAQ